MVYYLRKTFAVISFGLAIGWFVLLVQADLSGQMQAYALMLVMFAANGWLLWSAPNRVAAK